MLIIAKTNQAINCDQTHGTFQSTVHAQKTKGATLQNKQLENWAIKTAIAKSEITQ